MHFGVVDSRFLAKSIGLLNPPSPIVVGQKETIASVIRTLQTNAFGCVLVASEDGKLCGIVSERDILKKACLQEETFVSRPVEEIMTPSPRTADMTTSIAFVLNIMSQGGYRHVPIVDDEGTPIAIVSVRNIVDYIAGTLSKDLLSFKR